MKTIIFSVKMFLNYEKYGLITTIAYENILYVAYLAFSLTEN